MRRPTPGLPLPPAADPMTKLSLRHLLFALSLTAMAVSADMLKAQAPAPAFTPEEVGINEKLGATIPLDLALKGEDGKTVTLRQLIDKPTILTLNYFRCAGICTPQLGGVADRKSTRL